jgi:hypothetical protein
MFAAIENSILLQAQLPTAVDLLGAKGWDQKLVSTAMNGLNKRTNEANKKAKVADDVAVSPG